MEVTPHERLGRSTIPARRWLWLFLLCFLPKLSFAGTSVGLAWDASSDPGVVGYRLYVGTDPEVYSQSINAGSLTQAVASNLDWNTLYFFAVTAYDAAGLESDFSEPIAYRTPEPPQVVALPVIHEGPVGQLVAKGDDASLSIKWSGDAPGIFQWYKENLPLSSGPHYDGADSPTLTILDADDSCSGIYFVVVSNPSGQVRSLAASVHVLATPQIQSIAPLADGASRVTIAGENLTPLSPSQVFRLTIVAITNPASGAACESVTNGMNLKNGVLSAEDLSDLNYPQRYYRALVTGPPSSDVRLELPQSLDNGAMRIAVIGSDGLPLNSSDILNYEVRVRTNYAEFVPENMWTLLTHNCSYSNGILTVDDTNTSWGQIRAYKVFAK